MYKEIKLEEKLNDAGDWVKTTDKVSDFDYFTTWKDGCGCYTYIVGSEGNGYEIYRSKLTKQDCFMLNWQRFLRFLRE